MSVWRIFAVIGIFIATTIGWMILGVTIVQRTKYADTLLTGKISELWGSQHIQRTPSFVYYTIEKEKRTNQETGKEYFVDVKRAHYYDSEGSNIDVDFSLEYRRKGLVWFSTYKVLFAGEYLFRNDGEIPYDNYPCNTYVFHSKNKMG